MRQETRKIERSAAEKARLKAIRAEFQARKPTAKALEASGEYGPPIPAAAYFGVMAFVKQLREVREAAGLSLADLADQTGMDKAALSRLETGRHGNPTIDTLARYARALGKSVTFGLSDLEPPATPAHPANGRAVIPKRLARTRRE